MAWISIRWDYLQIMALVTTGKRMAVLATFFNPTPFAGAADLDIHGVGIREWMTPGLVDRPRGTDDVLLMAFHQAVTIGTEDGDVEAPANSLVAWQALAPHRYGRTDRSWQHSWIHATGSALDRHLRIAGLPRDVPIPGVDPRLIEQAAAAIHNELATHAEADPLIVENHLSTMLREIVRMMHGAAAPDIPADLLAVRRRLDARFHEPVVLADLARSCDWSVGHFCTRFKAAFGVPAVDLVVRLRLGRARALLRDPAVSVAAAAQAVGYDDPRTFARLVRRHLGCAPSALRG